MFKKYFYHVTLLIHNKIVWVAVFVCRFWLSQNWLLIYRAVEINITDCPKSSYSFYIVTYYINCRSLLLRHTVFQSINTSLQVFNNHIFSLDIISCWTRFVLLWHSGILQCFLFLEGKEIYRKVKGVAIN